MSSSGRRRTRAEELFAEFLQRSGAREGVDLELLCREHPEFAAEFRALHAWRSENQHTSFGAVLDPSVSLEPEPLPDPKSSNRLFEKLRADSGRGMRYKWLGEIARGGMGTIFRIWDEELRRTLAMKVVLGRDDSAGQTVEPRKLGRFLEEAQVTGQLDHPGIVPVYELGLARDGRAYFTMRLVKGEDLRTIFDLVCTGREGWNQVRALNVVLKVCEAMSYAHSKNVVHRDLKPANVMVGKFGEVYVMDWGLARVLGREDKHDLRLQPPASLVSDSDSVPGRAGQAGALADRSDSPLLTMDGDVVGTPSFMSPEQAQGKLDKLGPHSDVYAVGAMLYQLISGQMPFAPPDSKATLHSILERLHAGPPRSLHDIAPNTPAELIAICERAMAREIADRYPTMVSLAEDLRAYTEGRVVGAYETGAWAEARKWIGRNRSLAGALAAAVLILIAGVVTSTTFATLAMEKASALANANTTIRSRGEEIQGKNQELTVAKSAAESSAERAQALERVATQRANDVLSLSASKDLEELVARAKGLWPATPEMIPAFERWLSDARVLIDGRPADPQNGIRPRPSLEQHKTQLAALQRRALPLSEEEARADRESHPRAAELAAKRAEWTWRARMLGLEPWPSEEEVEAQLTREVASDSASELASQAGSLAALDKTAYGEETKALLLARRALALASSAERPQIRSILACAEFKLGRFDEAAAEMQGAIGEAASGKQRDFQTRAAKLASAIEPWKSEPFRVSQREANAKLDIEISGLEQVVRERRTFNFEDPEDAWWEVQQSKLIAALEALRDPKGGLMSNSMGEGFGWGVQKRCEFARTVRELSIDGAQASGRWAAAIEAIAASPKYGGLKLAPQLGLLPLGENPHSGLWEFAHLQTGAQAQRAPSGEFVASEDTGIIFVLIPGGGFWMGAQSRDPSGRNYDPAATKNESPVHEVVLSPFFLSKHELTQGQWMRIRDHNPSRYLPGNNYPGHERECLHPVELVSWEDSMQFLQELSLTLPSEAQWEMAARAGSSTPWWTGADRESLRGKVNLADKSAKDAGAPWGAAVDWPDYEDGFGVHAPAGSFPENPFGLCEVHGNVAEWCLDGYDSSFYNRAPRQDPLRVTKNVSSRVARGGSFRDPVSGTRVADRRSYAPTYSNYFLGLRPARAIAP